MRIWGLTVTLVLAVACGPPPTSVSRSTDGTIVAQAGHDDRTFHVVTLPSGKVLKLIVIRTIVYAPEVSPPVLMLKYQTDLPLDDVGHLREEARQIWPAFRANVEKAGLTRAQITA